MNVSVSFEDENFKPSSHYHFGKKTGTWASATKNSRTYKINLDDKRNITFKLVQPLDKCTTVVGDGLFTVNYLNAEERNKAIEIFKNIFNDLYELCQISFVVYYLSDDYKGTISFLEELGFKLVATYKNKTHNNTDRQCCLIKILNPENE